SNPKSEILNWTLNNVELSIMKLAGPSTPIGLLLSFRFFNSFISFVLAVADTVTHLVNRLEVYGFIAKFFPQAADVSIQCSGGRLAMITPYLVHQHLARQNISACAHQFFQKVEFFRG